MTDPQDTAASVLPPGVTHATLFPRIEFPELSSDGQPVWVEIRNPGMMPPAALEEAQVGLADIEMDAEGRPVDDSKAAPAVFLMLARMIRRWSVPDIMSMEDPLPMLPSPPKTADDIRQAPSMILSRVMDVVRALQNPQ